MPIVLPPGIVAYLRDSGFPEQELAVMEIILGNGSETSAVIAKKIGVSRHEAEKIVEALIEKKIILKGSINRQSRYSIQSLDTVVNWVKADMKTNNNAKSESQKNVPREYVTRKFVYENLLPIVLACVIFMMFSLIVGLYKLKIGFFEAV